jgi:tetratricopeptide (TPR) repeat protein
MECLRLQYSKAVQLKLLPYAAWLLAAALAASAVAMNSAAAMSKGDGDAARTALSQGRADDALQLLDTTLRLNPGDDEALSLRCRVFYAEERWDDAIRDCEHSVQAAPGNSSYHMWLGRAYGEKADRVSFVTAYKMAKLIHAEFETAASLDPKNGEALSDLGQYYLEAPAFLGGGMNKAEGVATQLDAFAPDRAHDLRARIAEQKKDYPGAEKEFRARIAASRTPAQAWMDLGAFYWRRNRADAMTATLKGGADVANHSSALVDGASTLVQAHQQPDLAITWMRQYLSGNALSEDAPAFAVHRQLGDLLKSQGNTQGAEQEYAAARSLARDYPGAKPSRKTNTGR